MNLIFCFIFIIEILFINAQYATIDTAIIGSGPAGLTAAIYSARAGLKTTVIQGQESGGQITLSPLLENFPGFPEGISGIELSQLLQRQAERAGALIIQGSVQAISKEKSLFRLLLHNGEELQARTVIIASGALPRWLGLPTEKRFIGRGISSCAICDGAFYHGKEVVVVGGGDSALEEALYLSNIARKVTVVHRRDELKGAKVLQERAFSKENITFVWSSIIEEIEGSPTNTESYCLCAVQVRNLINNTVSRLPCDGLFIAIGHCPNSHFFDSALELDQQGFIVTSSHSTATSIPGVFAAGDVADPTYRQAITAAASGCKAALDAMHYLKNR